MLDIRLGPPRRHDSLTVVPLITSDEAELPYLLLGDALAAGLLRITEVGSGTVPRLQAKNAGDRDILILDGEQLIGARQNRMTNRSILLAASSETEIPVSCMEQGRWHFTSRDFKPAPQHSPARVRRKARELEAYYVAEGVAPGEAALSEAQGDVWSEIADLYSNLNARSSTGALDEAYRVVGPDLDTWAHAFPVVDGQVGLLGLVGDRPIGVDIIGGRALYARLHDRLLRGYMLDALDAARTGTSGPDARSPVPSGEEPVEAGESRLAAAQRFLDAVRAAPRSVAPSVGRGTYEVLTGAVVGGALSDDRIDPERMVHLSAFPAAAAGEDTRESEATWHGPIARPSRRRRT